MMLINIVIELFLYFYFISKLINGYSYNLWCFVGGVVVVRFYKYFSVIEDSLVLNFLGFGIGFICIWI